MEHVGSLHVGSLIGSFFDAHPGSYHAGSIVNSLIISIRGVRG